MRYYGTREAEVYEYLRKCTKGASIIEIAAHLGIRVAMASNYTRQMRRQRTAIFCGIGTCGRWATLDNESSAMAAYQVRRDAMRAISQASTRERKQRWLESLEVEGDKPFVHILIRAVEGAPIPKLGPASVWELAA